MTESRLQDIWSHFTEKLAEIDALEAKVDEHATRARRRVASVLDQTPAHRSSHLRLFVTHHLDDGNWNLVVEGKLLIAWAKYRGRGRSQSHLSVDDGKPPPVPSPRNEESGRDRDRYRSQGEREEEPLEPTIFSHFFDKMVVTFQTVYQPENPSLTPPKKSRSTKRKSDSFVSPMVNPKTLKTSSSTQLVVTKSMAPDAQAVCFQYPRSIAAPEDMSLHSVTATIHLHPTRPETLYRISSIMADKFFPKNKNLKRKPSEGIPLENEIHVPGLLSEDEITMALYQYVTDRQLLDPNDKSYIQCDKVLSGLLDTESIPFSQMWSTLLSKALITPVGLQQEPIVLKYVMKETSVSPQVPVGMVLETKTSSSSSTDESSAERRMRSRTPDPVSTTPTVLSFDMDVAVPSFFHYRAREMMRRVKRREFEYTSSRTRARYLLVASKANEDMVKAQIEECISGHGYSGSRIPVFLALAKAAPPLSEARGAAQADARICALVEKLDEVRREAQEAWDLVDACREMTKRQKVN